jgi:hypothetical protein
MAKRTRGTGRPGQRGPIVRSGARPPSVRPSAGPHPTPTAGPTTVGRRPGGLTTDEEIRAAELEEKIIAQEREAEAAQRRVRERVRTAEVTGVRQRESAPLAVRAAAEYAYVRRDILRIARVAAVLLLIVGVLHVLINVMGVVRV